MSKFSKYYFFYNGPFSQWLYSPFWLDGLLFESAEQWMMHQKAMTFGDEQSAAAIMKSHNPAEQKLIGRRISNYDDAIWSEKRFEVVKRGSTAKFSENKFLASILKSTGNKILAEASPWDNIWGIGLSENNPLRFNEKNWTGRNLLGKALMEVRSTL